MDTPILVIEDDLDQRFLVSTQLSRADFADVTVVATLEEGYAALEERPRDVVVIDSSVVRDDRRGALSRFKAVCSGARVIAYSAIGPDEIWADAHFVKGEDTQAFFNEIAKGRLA